MGGNIFSFIGLLSVLPLICSAIFNSYELRTASYDIAIDSVPEGFQKFKLDNYVNLESLADITDTSPSDIVHKFQAKQKKHLRKEALVVTSEFGQRFHCPLPDRIQAKRSDALGQTKSSLPVETVFQTVELAFSMTDCIRKNFGWWTYKLCHGQRIEQYHLGDNGEIVGDIISLGIFQGNYSLPDFVPKENQPFFFEERFENGTLCELTGRPRKSLVKYFCDQLLSSTDAYLDSVEERSSCEYILNVRTGSLCQYDRFLPIERSEVATEVICRPLLDENGAVDYVKLQLKAAGEKIESKRLAATLLDESTRIQRQRYARKRTSLNDPESMKVAKVADDRLKAKFQDIMRRITKLESKGLDDVIDMHFVFDNIADMKDLYDNDRDEDRGNLFWFFNDPSWDRTFFPRAVADVRKRNKFRDMMSKVFKKLGQNFDRSGLTYEDFIEQVRNGTVDEIRLRLILGTSLHKAFREKPIPVLQNFQVSSGYSVEYDEYLFDPALVYSVLEEFEGEVLSMLESGERIDGRDVMRHVAKTILRSRNRMKAKYHMFASAIRKQSYAECDHVFELFADAYNDAVKRFDNKPAFDLVEKIIGRPLTEAEIRMWVNRIKINDITPSLQYLAYTNQSLGDEERILSETIEQLLARSSKGKLGTLSGKERELKSESDEKLAERRMIARTRRWNLAEKVEAFFRRNPNEDEAEKLSPHELLKQQLLLFKESLQSKLKETGLVQDAEVHIQILDTGSKEAGATITGIAAAFSEGLSREDSSQIERMMKAVMEEQQTIKAEKIRVRSLQKGYLFGADENEVRTHEEDDEEETNELKEAIIPLLKQNFL